MIIKELKPIFSNVKSFYKKAKILRDEQTTILQSYNTIILKIDKDGNITRNSANYNFTATTVRHCKEFLQQFTNLQNLTKKDILKFKEF